MKSEQPHPPLPSQVVTEPPSSLLFLSGVGLAAQKVSAFPGEHTVGEGEG